MSKTWICLVLCVMAFTLSRGALAQQPAEPAWREAEKVLADERASQEMKISACRAIARAGNVAVGAQNQLIISARGDGPLHSAAMNALRAVSDDRALLAKYLLFLLQQGGEPANAAADVLAEVGKDAEPAVPQLIQMLGSRDFGTCRRALTVLNGLGAHGQKAAPAVLRLMLSPAWEIREAAVPVLLSITVDDPVLLYDAPAICEPILVLRNDKASDDNKIDACAQLERLGPKALPAVFDLEELAQRDGAVHIAAQVALNAIGEDAKPLLAHATVRPGLDRQFFPEPALTTTNSSMTDLRRMLEGSSVARRVAACAELKVRGARASEALDILHTHLHDPVDQVRSAAAEAILAIDPRANPKLLHAAADLDEIPSSRALRALEGISQMQSQGVDINDAIPGVAKLLLSESAGIRELAAGIVWNGPLPDRQSAAALREVYRLAPSSSSPQIAGAAQIVVLRGLVHADNDRLTNSHVIEFVRGLVHADDERLTRSYVIETLGDQQLGDAAASALAGLGPAASGWSGFFLDLAETSAAYSRRATRVLAGIGPGSDNPDRLVRLLSLQLADRDPSFRAAAALALGKIGLPAKGQLERIVQMIQSTDDTEAAAAAHAVGEFADVAAPQIGALSLLLKARMEQPPPPDGSPDPVRAALAEAVAHIAPASPETRELLLTAVRQRDWAVRERLAPAMANRLTPPTLLASLTQLSKSPDSLVQLNARCALREIGEVVPADVGR